MENYKEFYVALKNMHLKAMRLDATYRKLADKHFDEFAALLGEDGILIGEAA